MLNSDMSQYQPTIIFHIEEALYKTAQPIFETAAIPDESIIVFPTDLCTTDLNQNALHKACAPFIDPQLEQFERVIVLDADSFSLGNEKSGLVPLMDVSLNKMSPDQIILLRGWTQWEPVRDEYKNWYDHGGVGKEGWIQTAANYCHTTPERINDILYPVDASKTPRPFHNGAYISIPMRALRDNPEFRAFIHEVSCTMGNEEIAMAIWAMKHFIKTGKYFPSDNLQDYIFEHGGFHLEWNLDNAWSVFHDGTPCLVHLYGYDTITHYIHDWARAIHASESEAKLFGDKVIDDVQQLKESASEC